MLYLWHSQAIGMEADSKTEALVDGSMRKAIQATRLPDEAEAVLKEIRADLRTYIWETPMQKMVRLDREFEQLEQGGMTHADFRAMLEDKIQDMKECKGLDMPTTQTLFRKYLTKLSPDLRGRIMSKV